MEKYIVYADWIKDYITLEPYTLCKELEALGWTLMEMNDKRLTQIMLKACTILFVTYDSLDITKYKSHPECKIIYKIDDQHGHNEIRSKFLSRAWRVISPYAYLLNRPNKIWIPYSCVDSILDKIQNNPSPINKIFISGAVRSEYPFRSHVVNLKDERIVRLDHPGYHNKTGTQGIDYFNLLNKCICCFTDASMYRYILLKNFEICGVGSLLLTDLAIQPEMEQLGFKDNVNCIFCNKETFLTKIEYILDPVNRAEVDRIRSAGMVLVRSSHMTSMRAKSIDTIISSL
jgi:hypothetical protein